MTAPLDSLTGDAPLAIDAEGRLIGVRHIESPNCDARPDGCDVSLVVVHGISLPPGEFGGRWVEALFTNALDASAHPYFETIASLRVSAHVLVQRDGGIIQFVPFALRAWHAGASCWNGRERCNDFSVGIELEGTDDDAYTDAQYAALRALVSALVARYPIDAIAGHSDIAPERKTDPGPAFEWSRLARSFPGLCAARSRAIASQ